MPLARILVIALALSHAVGIAELVRKATCEEECQDDGCTDECGPNEPSCACHCPTAPTLIGAAKVQVIEQVAMPLVVAPCSGDHRVHANPDPREILHVPRPALVGVPS